MVEEKILLAIRTRDRTDRIKRSKKNERERVSFVTPNCLQEKKTFFAFFFFLSIFSSFFFIMPSFFYSLHLFHIFTYLQIDCILSISYLYTYLFPKWQKYVPCHNHWHSIYTQGILTMSKCQMINCSCHI
jgi:hypothetical protein